MQKLAELSRENPDWEEKCKLENLRWSEIANFTKAMWRNITRNLMDIKIMNVPQSVKDLLQSLFTLKTS